MIQPKTQYTNSKSIESFYLLNKYDFIKFYVNNKTYHVTTNGSSNKDEGESISRKEQVSLRINQMNLRIKTTWTCRTQHNIIKFS